MGWRHHTTITKGGRREDSVACLERGREQAGRGRGDGDQQSTATLRLQTAVPWHGLDVTGREWSTV